MGIKSSISSVLTVAAVGLVVILLFGQLLGQPIGIGYVVTGSMSGTLEPGDGFVAIPPPLAGEIETGDVVTFEAEEIQGGGLTTHRIVGETNQGYITRGDANPFSDQDGGEPPVRESDIVAVALQFDGSVVTIPNIGTVVMGLQGILEGVFARLSGIPGLGWLASGGFGTTMIGIGLLVMALSFLGDLVRGRSREGRERDTDRNGVINSFLILLVIVFLITAPATLSMVVPSGTNEVQVISSTSPTDSPTIIERGGSNELFYNGSNSGFVPRVVIIEPRSEGVDVSEGVMQLSPGESGSSVVTVSVPDETGAYLRVISERHYVQVLPLSVIVTLHRIHPWVAILGIDLLLAGFVTLIYGLTVGFGPLRLRSRERNLSLTARLKRKLP